MNMSDINTKLQFVSEVGEHVGKMSSCLIDLTIHIHF
jgi:hypothetical protein